MRPPRIHSMVVDIVQTAISAFDGAEFTQLSFCPFCGGPVSGYDTIIKRFAVIREYEYERVVRVTVRRFTCRSCSALCSADQPFYPGTRIGSPVIDLFLTIGSTLPKSRAARVIDTLGIIVNRTTWKNYPAERFPEIPAATVFGVLLPLSVVSLSSLAAKIPKGSSIQEAEVLAACGFPSAYRAAHPQAFSEKGGAEQYILKDNGQILEGRPESSADHRESGRHGNDEFP